MTFARYAFAILTAAYLGATFALVIPFNSPAYAPLSLLARLLAGGN